MNQLQIKKAVCFVRYSARKKQTEGLNDEDKEKLYQLLASVGEAFPYQMKESRYVCDNPDSKKYDWIKSKVYDLLGI